VFIRVNSWLKLLTFAFISANRRKSAAKLAACKVELPGISMTSSNDFSDAVVACARACGLRVARPAELPDLRRLATDLISPQVTPLEGLRMILRKTRSGILVFEEAGGALTGMLAIARLTDKGHEALLTGCFNPLAPSARHYAGPGDPVAAVYALGIAARSREAARATVTACTRLRETVMAELPFFARPATAAGRRVLTERLHCSETVGGLLWSPPRRPESAV